MTDDERVLTSLVNAVALVHGLPTAPYETVEKPAQGQPKAKALKK